MPIIEKPTVVVATFNNGTLIMGLAEKQEYTEIPVMSLTAVVEFILPTDKETSTQIKFSPWPVPAGVLRYGIEDGKEVDQGATVLNKSVLASWTFLDYTSKQPLVNSFKSFWLLDAEKPEFNKSLLGEGEDEEE